MAGTTLPVPRESHAASCCFSRTAVCHQRALFPFSNVSGWLLLSGRRRKRQLAVVDSLLTWKQVPAGIRATGALLARDLPGFARTGVSTLPCVFMLEECTSIMQLKASSRMLFLCETVRRELTLIRPLSGSKAVKVNCPVGKSLQDFRTPSAGINTQTWCKHIFASVMQIGTCVFCSIAGGMCGMPSRVLLRRISGNRQCRRVWSSLSRAVPQGTLLPPR